MGFISSLQSCTHEWVFTFEHLSSLDVIFKYDKVGTYKVKCSHNGTIPLIIIHAGWILSTTDLKPYTPHNVLLTLWVFISLCYTIHLSSLVPRPSCPSVCHLQYPTEGLHCWCGIDVPPFGDQEDPAWKSGLWLPNKLGSVGCEY